MFTVYDPLRTGEVRPACVGTCDASKWLPHVLSLAERTYDEYVYAWMMPDESIMIGSNGWQWREGDCANRQPWNGVDWGIGKIREWSPPLNDQAAVLESLTWQTPYKPGIVMNGWWNKPGMFVRYVFSLHSMQFTTRTTQGGPSARSLILRQSRAWGPWCITSRRRVMPRWGC